MDKIRFMCKRFFKTPVREPGGWGAPTGEAADHCAVRGASRNRQCAGVMAAR